MPRRKKDTQDVMENASKLDIKRTDSRSSSKKAKTKSRKKLESTATSGNDIKDMGCRVIDHEKPAARATRRSGNKRTRHKKAARPDEEDADADISVSDYFSASQDGDRSAQNKPGKRKLKTEKNSSYASKLKTLKDIGSDGGSDEEFEAISVNYRSPKDRKNKLSEINKSVEKQARKSGQVTEVSNVKEKTESDNNAKKNAESISEKERTELKPKKKKNEKSSKAPSNRKRKSADTEGATNNGNEVEVKKPKRQIHRKAETQSKAEAHRKAEIKGVSGEERGDIGKKNNKKPKEAKAVKNNDEELETDCVLVTLQKTEGKCHGNKTLGKAMEKGSDESSDEEEMMDIVECPETNSSITPGVKLLPQSLDHADAMAVLMHMEGPKQNLHSLIPSTSKGVGEVSEAVSDGDSSDEESDWEDVEDHHGNSPKKSQLPSGPVEITLEAPVIYKKRKRGEFDLQAYFKRQINKFKREVAMDIHKVHLLCLLSRCQYLNRLCNDETVQAQAFSLTLVTKQLKVPPIRSCTESHVTQVLAWIKEKKNFLEEVMADGLNGLSAQLRVTLICVILLHQVGFLTRLMTSLQPVPFKETSSKKGKMAKSRISKGQASQKNENKGSTSKTDKKTNSTKQNSKVKAEKMKNEKMKTVKVKTKNIKAEKGGKEDSKSESKDTRQSRPQAKKRRSSDRKCSRISKNAYKDQNSSDEEMLSDDEDFIPVGDSDDDSDGGDERNETAKGKQKRSGKKLAKGTKTEVKSPVKDEPISDDDFEEDSILIRTQQLKKDSPGRKNKKVLSSDDENSTGVDNWAEVYLQKEQKWICIDCVAVEVKKPYEIENTATHPVCYVVGITQDGYIRDVTARYASHWLTETRKQRVDSEWWEETLEPYTCPDKQRNKIEDDELNSHLYQRPLPTSVGAFKSHPLYALRRHLLKFEAIYPDSAIPVGYIKGEPVYARECVHTLHSRENWLKEGRAVRVGEEPYKFVKSRAKWNRPKEDPEAKDLELFGRWQTEQYIPPPAVDGKVPRNAHGNVEMFLPSMLPAGTVHLKIPGLNKVAKKLDIDCAPAMVGWDHHCGFSHPLMDGWIVCEEFKDILLAAWDEEQEIIREKEQQKREKRVYDNWRKLIRGMLIKERLKKRFDLEEKPVEEKTSDQDTVVEGTSQLVSEAKQQTSPVSVEKAEDRKHAWPQNRIGGDQYTLCTVEKM